MATNPTHDHQKPATPPGAPGGGHAASDELTGVYGFFRRRQKLLLYTAGLFTLLTFSITGPIMSLVSSLFSTPPPMPSINVSGKRLKLTPDDYHYGQLLSRNQIYGLPPGVMLPILSAEGGDSDLIESFAILRSAAVAEGVGVSWEEVDRAIEAARELAKLDSATKLARARNFGSLALYRDTVAEAMRIGLYMRLQLLALDTGDAEVMRQAIGDREKITLKVATFDEKAHQAELKAATTLSDDDLHAWLDKKTATEKQRMGAFDLPRAELRFSALLLADGQFDPAQWQDDYLKDFAMGDDQLKSYYDQDKDLRFKNETGDGYKPFEDEAVKAELLRIAQAERVMNELLGKLRQQQIDALQPQNEALEREQGRLADARATEQAARSDVMGKQATFDKLEKELAAKPDDAELKATVEQHRTELQAAKDAVFQAEAVVPAMQAAVDAAQAAVNEARKAFDFPAKIAELTQGKSGFVAKAMTGMVDSNALKDLDKLGLELGEWPLATQGTSLQNVGDLGFSPGRTKTAVVLYQATQLERQPLKSWDVLKPLVEDAYWAEKAKADGLDKKKAMEDALLRLAKELMPEFVTTHAAERQSRVDAKIKEWEDGVNQAIAEAKDMLAIPNLGTRARTDWQRKFDTKTAELAQKPQRSEQMANAVDRDIENEIKQEAQKHYGKVLDAAAAEAGFTIRDLDAYPRDLQRRPRFDKRFDPTVVYLFRTQSELKVDAATAVLQDAAERRYHVAVCTKVEPLGPEDVTRREFELERRGTGLPFARLQLFNAMGHVFSREELDARYQFEKVVGTQTDLAPAAQ